ncbi:deleted in malignant brain tumors 1 protein-like isoform X1 [Manacus candei]|uniref:deleted in malignant brain tumors 1 protein-like isoform X1 n=1 Tax=Manacus candei TaxID=415023 RepID=UPI002226D589|nr:deleted in malignant brain tumors 1 protein-like isoform X1 [Manacus candei]
MGGSGGSGGRRTLPRGDPLTWRGAALRTLLAVTYLCGVSPSPPGVSVRLQGGPDGCSGRVEVLHNLTWGTVCDDGWGVAEGEVTCAQVGCGRLRALAPGARYGEGEGPIWLDEVKCAGHEGHLEQCRARPWGQHNCGHGEDVGVECADSVTSSLGSLQLREGPDRCSGRVELLHLHRWGTVCDDGWDLQDAQVICHQLGCGHALAAPGHAHFGRGHDAIWLDEVNCTGTENSILECPAKPWGDNNCFHGEDAGVICSASRMAVPAQVRLANGSTRCQGQVQVSYGGTWATLCDHGWGLAEGQVVCRQLGCGHALSAPGGSWFGREQMKVWPGSVTCVGTEQELLGCQVKPWENRTCHLGGAAGVVCTGNPEADQVRLVSSGSRCAGRVEVFHNGRWGTVCDDTWDLADAQVVCRQMGCGKALSAPGRAQFGRGTGIIWLDETNCTGAEPHLSACPARPWGRNDCYHGEDAGVVCSDSLIPEPPHLRLVNGSHRCAGRVELLHLDRWGGVCAGGWSHEAAQVVCRYLGCGTALRGAEFGTPGQVWLDQVSCQGTEKNLGECRTSPWAQRTCEGGRAAGVVCSGAEPSGGAQVRLVGGPGECAGRVEVLHAGAWGTVCDDTWDFAAATVVCRSLGCGQVISAPPRARFGEGHGPIWLDGLTCQGHEGHLDECRHKSWGIHGCEHNEDASVVCAGSHLADLTHLRLADGADRCSGRVQVLHAGRWGGICAHSWHLAAAKVVCAQVGCGGAAAVDQVRPGEGELTWLEAVTCRGDEGALLECQVKGWGGPRTCGHGGHAHVTCTGVTQGRSGFPGSSGEPGELRLADGPHRCSGRVEVLHNHTWGTVCGHTWDLAAAQVVCRHLGCGHALSTPGAARFGAGPGPAWLDGFRCVGNETTIAQCPGSTWGRHTCDHLDHAGVVCSGAPPAGNSSSGEVRLVDGPHLCMGRVEVLHDGQWGTVCDDSWDLKEAQVVCRQVGCGEARAAHGHAHFGQGAGPIWLDDITCTGDETHLVQCRAQPWGSNNCHHGEDAGVVCSGANVTEEQFQVRLVGGPTPCAGRVEVLHEHRWGTVCDDTWDLRDARVTCRQLGCGDAVAAPSHAHFGEGAGPVLLDHVGCTGEENTLEECDKGPWGVHNCNHEEDASVVCAGPTPLQVRLRDGPGPCAGQVQVLHNHTWMGVCGRTWSLLEAQVVCKELGCGPALSAPVGAHLAPGAALEGLTCRGSETLLLECLRERARPGTCHTGGAAGVVCAMPKGVPPTCAPLVALLGLLTSLSGVLLWLTLRTRCVGEASGKGHLGAIYLPRRVPPEEVETLQLIKDDAP